MIRTVNNKEAGFMRRYLTISLYCVFFTANVYSQSDSTVVLGIKDFIARVKEQHPIAKQAALLVNMAEAELMAAKGNFDPKAGFDASSKNFDGKNYYGYLSSELKIPLPIGDIASGIENNGGDFLSSETSKGRSSYLGIEIPVLRGLLIDKRRAVLQQARVFKNQSEQEQLAALNELLFDAYSAYWHWAGCYETYRISSEYVSIAEKRRQLVKIGYRNGDRPAMDTIEAFSQWQQYTINQSEAAIKLMNAVYTLSDFLWKDNNNELLPDYYRPENLSGPLLPESIAEDELLALSQLRNPVLKSYEYKIKGLEVDRKLKAQNLLPYLSVKANLLYKEYSFLKSIDPVYIQNNNKWGLSFRVPVFLREERGNLQKAQIKLKDAGLEYTLKKQQLSNKIRSYIREYRLLLEQLKRTQVLFNNYQSLLRNEELRFQQGESSLFLINSREMKLVEAAQKQVELTIKYRKAKYAAEWAAGVIE